MRLLGIDYGDKRTGLAVHDGALAVPYGIIEAETLDALIAQLAPLVQEEEITGFVVGVPLALQNGRSLDAGMHLKDAQNDQTKKVFRFIDALRVRFSFPVEMVDERLSTKEAANYEKGIPRRVRTPTDAVAAMIILQQYLDKHHITHNT